MSEFFTGPLFIGGMSIAAICFLWECANCLGRIRDDMAIMRGIEQRRAAEENKYYMEALDREIAAHDARMARAERPTDPSPPQPL